MPKNVRAVGDISRDVKGAQSAVSLGPLCDRPKSEIRLRPHPLFGIKLLFALWDDWDEGREVISCLLRLVRKASITQRSPDKVPSTPKFQVFRGRRPFLRRKVGVIKLTL
jgi:hypothetical protein